MILHTVGRCPFCRSAHFGVIWLDIVKRGDDRLHHNAPDRERAGVTICCERFITPLPTKHGPIRLNDMSEIGLVLNALENEKEKAFCTNS